MGPRERRVVAVLWLIAGFPLGAACFPDPPARDDGEDLAPVETEDGADIADVEALVEVDAPIDSAQPETVVDSSVPEETIEDSGPPMDTAPPQDSQPETETEVEADTVTPDTAETEVTVEDTSEPDTTQDIEAEVDDSAADTRDVEDAVDTTDTSDTIDTVDDTDTGADVEEPDVDPCPGGCTHLDTACQHGLCTESGCMTENLDGACDDGLACTTLDRCEEGVCTGDPIVCEASDDCHIAGVCNPTTGLCSDPAKPNTTPCDDADPCTEAEACQEGACTGGVVPDDSGDWFVRTSAFGASELRLQADGTVWWFVTLIAQHTTVGKDNTGTDVVVTLPANAVRGVAAIQFDASGSVIRSLMLAHSEYGVDFLGGPYARSRVVEEPLFGIHAVVAVVTFESELTIPGGSPSTLISTSGAPRSFAVLAFKLDGSLLNVLQIENPGFSESIDPRDGVQPGIGVGSDGQLLITTTLGADKRGEVVGKADYRAPADSLFTTWILRFTLYGSLTWQRALVGRDNLSGATGRLVVLDGSGNAFVAGVYTGTVDWRRTDSPDALQTLPVPTGFENVVLKIDSSADVSLVSRLTGGFTNVLVMADSNRFGGVSIDLTVSTDLRHVTAGGSDLVVADPPNDGLEFAVVELDGAGDPMRIVRNPGLSLHRFEYRAEELILGTLANAELLVDDADLFPALPAQFELAISGLADHAWSFPAIVQSGAPDAQLTSIAFGVGAQHGIAVAGTITAGAIRVGSEPTWLANAGEGFIALLNSESGLVCADR